MSSTKNILVVIPARGGSKGIPRKNLRSLNGRPLIYYSINNALGSRFSPDVFVSTEDEEIGAISEKLGARVVRRNPILSADDVTLDGVIFEAWNTAKISTGKHYDLIVTMQPTSPLLQIEQIDDAIALMIQKEEIDTVISAKEDTHLSWRKDGDRFVPKYLERLNRQYLEKSFRETGGFLITRPTIISRSNRIGKNVHLALLSGGQDIDIDTYDDWSVCEFYLKRKRILFVVAGNEMIGLGHVYNTLILANDILNHRVIFLVDSGSRLAFEKISSLNYEVHMQATDDLVEDIVRINPDVVVNDRLDTSADYVRKLKNKGFKVINFEDLGEGAKLADLVVNAIYPEKDILPNHYFGHDYFVLRDEFHLSAKKLIEPEVTNVLITFGGVDPNNLTFKVIESIYDSCIERKIQLNVVAGFGYDKYASIAPFTKAIVHRNSKKISEHMLAADVIFTSAGRTTYEVASLGVPCIVMAQNERELTHFFASAEYGFQNLGLGMKVSNETISRAFISLVESSEKRQAMNKLMQKVDVRLGRMRVNQLIQQQISLL